MNRLRFVAMLPASAVLFAAVACTPASPVPQAAEVSTMTPALPSEPTVLPAEPPATIVAVTPTATPQPVDPSRQVAIELQAVKLRTVPVLQGFERWAKAIGAGLPAQPNEVEDLRAQVVAIDQDARTLRGRAHADGMSPHVQRAADATSGASKEILAGVDLADETVDLLINKRQLQSGLTTANLAVDHIKRATKLYAVVNDELDAYAQESPVPQTV